MRLENSVAGAPGSSRRILDPRRRQEIPPHPIPARTRRLLDTAAPSFDHGLAIWTILRLVHPASKAARVETSSRYSWSRRLARLLAPAVLLAIIFGQGGSASAVAVSSTSDFDAHEHSQYCGCGVKCKQKACCCGPEDEKPRSGAPAPTGAGPCMNSAPCGEPMPPDAPATGSGVKAAALASWGRENLVDAGRRQIPLSTCNLPPRRPSRLDDPPERLDVA